MCTPPPAMAKSISLVAPVAALESRIAWRSDPAPVSFVLLTRKVLESNCRDSSVREPPDSGGHCGKDADKHG